MKLKGTTNHYEGIAGKVREEFERNNIKTLKQYCKQKGIKQINF